MPRRVAVLAVILALTAVPGARAQSLDQQWIWCKDATNHDLAIGGCTALIQSGKLSPEDLATALTDRGGAYAHGGQYDSAMGDFDQAIRLNPNSADALANRGDAYDHKGQYDRAIADFDQALRLDPNLATAFNNRGNAYGHKGDNDRAITDYDKAIGLKPDFAEAFNGRGKAYSAKGAFGSAIANFDQATRLNPAYAEAFGNRGEAYGHMGQYDRAVPDFDEAIRLDPNDAEAFHGRGDAYQHLGQNDRAIADFAQAIRLNPKYAKAAGDGGNTHGDKGKYESSLRPYLIGGSFIPLLLLICYGVRKTNGRWNSLALWIGIAAGGGMALIASFAEQMLARLLHIGATSTLASAAIKGFVVVAIPEEVVKFIALSLITLVVLESRRLQDVLLLAVGIGMGFASIENLLYLGPAHAWQFAAVARSVSAVPVHGILGLMMGALIIATVLSEGNRLLGLLFALVVPILLHGGYDTLSSVSDGSLNWIFPTTMLAMTASGLVAVGMSNMVLPEAAAFDQSAEPRAASSDKPSKLLSRIGGGLLFVLLAVVQFTDFDPTVCWMAAFLGVLPLVLASDPLFTGKPETPKAAAYMASGD